MRILMLNILKWSFEHVGYTIIWDTPGHKNLGTPEKLIKINFEGRVV